MKWNEMTPEHRKATLHAMYQFGGSFCKSLALAWMRADTMNAQKLADAFPQYVECYSAMVEEEA